MYIEQYLNSSRVATQISKINDDTFSFLVDPDKERFLQGTGARRPSPEMIEQYALLDEVVPVRVADDWRVLEYLIEKNLAIASVIGIGGEIPQTRAGRLTELRGEMFKLGISHIYDEKDQWRMLDFMKMPNVPQAFLDMLFGSVDDLQPRIFKLANVLTWLGLQTGQVPFTDPRTGIVTNLKYNTYSELFPAPLTGAARWSQAATANGIQNLRDHAEAWYDLNGFYPKYTAMSRRRFLDLTAQTSSRDYGLNLGAITNASPSGSSSLISGAILDKICEQLQIPKIRIFDAQYEIETQPGQTQRGRYLNSDTYVFLSDNMGERLFGPTIENEGKPGVFVKTEQLRSSPVQDRSYAVATMIPFFAQPKYLAARKVD